MSGSGSRPRFSLAIVAACVLAIVLFVTAPIHGSAGRDRSHVSAVGRVVLIDLLTGGPIQVVTDIVRVRTAVRPPATAWHPWCATLTEDDPMYYVLFCWVDPPPKDPQA